jgi:hypothetical protein
LVVGVNLDEYELVSAGIFYRRCVFARLRIDWGGMPRTKVILYCEEDGLCPFLEWVEQLPVKAQDKCLVRVERLRELGMNCGGRKRICFGMESTNSVRVCRASIIGFSISSTVRLRRL